MGAIVRPLLVAVSACSLMGASSAREQEYSPQLLAQLDPTKLVSNLCQDKAGTDGMRSRLAVAASMTGGLAVAPVALPEGSTRIRFPITTSSPDAQRHFDQGLALAYGFNHAGAIASFREAQKLDPTCAMCFWGEALAYGPNINAPMDVTANARAVALARYAQWLARNSSGAEQALTAAMLKRYSADGSSDRAALDAAYADAMLEAAAAHPEHDDIALLAAEAAMDTRPWDYWQADGHTPQPRIGEAVRLVESVLARNVDHPQAAHLYIHLMESGPDPKRAEAAADRLAAPLAPTLGHLVHMPAHIYFRLGRWKDSLRVNIAAARADEEWIRTSGDSGLVRYGYYPHNVHFIVTSAQMAGDMGTAIRESRKLAQILDPSISARIAWVQAINAAPYFAAAQFATPGQILAMQAPDERLPYASAMRHYSRAIARARQRNRAGFEQEMASLRAYADHAGIRAMVDQGVPAPDLIKLAESSALGRWAYANGQYRQAERHYRDAIVLEEKIPYMEPPYWYYPVHQSLGAALYRQNRFDDAADAFTTALARSPNNGWALYGLAEAQRASANRPQAAATRAALERAWSGDPAWLKMDRL